MSTHHNFSGIHVNINEYFSLKTPFIPGVKPDATVSSPAFWFLFHGEKLLIQTVKKITSICTFTPKQLGLRPTFIQYLGKYGSTDCYMAEVQDLSPLPANYNFRGLRGLLHYLENDIFTLAGRALQTLHWHKEHRFCGKCGAAMKNRESELAKICPDCGFISFPRLSPVVIMSVVRDDKILLARSPHFTKGMYSTLAGFVEPGETLEEAIKREVREEVNITIKNIRYVSSQPWPFPHSLMIGFSADYSAGKIQIDDKELEDAGWFSVHNLPPLPSQATIARLLIDNFIKNCSKHK